MLGDAVSVYLDGGIGGSVPSTIIDATGLVRPDGKLRIVREGAIPADEIRSIVGEDRCA
jgi:tRNA A37 threonylcarbamoyladenosine synthetase subunit TsaC/SUA5/YrdC